MPSDILNRIVADRRRRVAGEGASQGVALPLGPYGDEAGGAAAPARDAGRGAAENPRKARDAAGLPLVSFPGPVICEIKRRSPSRGDLAAHADPVERAGRYRAAGCDTVSVLTEQDHFSGALTDLIAVKRVFSDLAVLRKDFLLTTEDVHVSWRAGADAVLVIAAILTRDDIAALIAAAELLGLTALVEIHNREELRTIAPLRPAVVGINSRDLRTFRVDLLEPSALAAEIDWPCRLVFESGIFHREDVRVARDGGFSAVLVGESVVGDPGRVTMLVEEMSASAVRATAPSPPPAAGAGAGAVPGAPDPHMAGAEPRPFWPWLATRRAERAVTAPHRPLVKICGITSVADAELALELGADLLGLIYAESPRTAPEGLAAEIRAAGVSVPLVAVVLEKSGVAGTEEEANAALLARAQRDLAAGAISVLQLHGSSAPEEALSYGWPAYKAVRFRSAAAALEQIPALRTPRFLIDAFHPAAAGGTGHAVPDEVLSAVAAAITGRPHGALWLAGGLNPDTVEEAIVRWRPELIDASSGLEAVPGKKDPALLRRYFERIDVATRQLATARPEAADPAVTAAAEASTEKDGTQ